MFVGVRMNTDKGRFGVLNVLSLRPLLALAVPKPMDYSAESAEGRRIRRERRWTPVAAESLHRERQHAGNPGTGAGLGFAQHGLGSPACLCNRSFER